MRCIPPKKTPLDIQRLIHFLFRRGGICEANGIRRGNHPPVGDALPACWRNQSRNLNVMDLNESEALSWTLKTKLFTKP